MAARVVSLSALVAVVFAVPGCVDAQGMPSSLTQFVQQTIGLNHEEMNAAATGKTVVKTLETPDHLEVAVFGIVSIAVPRAFYVQRAADFPSSLRSPTRVRFALFSDSAIPSDVATLSLPHDDIDHLERCRVGSCNLKLSAGAIARVRASMDSAPSSPDSVAGRYFRGRAVEYVTAYRTRGNAALIAYADEDSVTAAAQVFDAMLSRSPYLYQYAPSLERYLKNYPNDRPTDLSEALFWADDDLPGLHRTITITHEIVYAPPELPGCTLIVAKQLYADHYFDGAIDVMAVVDQAGPPEPPEPPGPLGQPGVYLVILRRLHFDELPSGGLINVRGKVIGKLRDAMRTSLGDAKTVTERAYASAPPSPR